MKLLCTKRITLSLVLLAIPVLFPTFLLQDKTPAARWGANPKVASATAAPKDTDSSAIGPEADDNMILVELCSQGLLDPGFLRTDEKFGALVDTEYPLVLEGFRVWAPSVTGWMRRSKQITLWVSQIAQPWMLEMAYVMGENANGSFIGKIEMYFGFIFSWAIGVTITYFYVQIALLLLVSLWMYLSLRRLFKAIPIPVWNVSRKESLNEKI
ncbi:MAG TPA: hypothetical protein VHY08_25345 [Bacillota bacterium]|nr:hypothetical protein [Bacillota bacterium]